MRFAFILCALSALFLFSPRAEAGQRVITVNGAPFVTVDVPGGWRVSEVARGLELRSRDDEAYVWFESYGPSQEKAIFAEHDRYFSGQGVVVSGEPHVTKAQEIEGNLVTFLEFDATWKGARTLLRYALVDPRLPSGRLVLVSFWASPKGGGYDEDVLGMIASLKPARR